MRTTMIVLSHAHLATLRAALRVYREQAASDSASTSQDLTELATDCGALTDAPTEADVEELDTTLCEALATVRQTSAAAAAWVVQHEFDDEPTYVVNAADEDQDICFAASIPHALRLSVARDLAARLSGSAPRGGTEETNTASPFARMGWSVADVQSLASGLDDSAAEEWLANNQNHIRDRLIELGWGVIEDLLQADGTSLDPDDGPDEQEDGPDRRALADECFINFDFGEGVEVVHHNGWLWEGDTRASKTVFVSLRTDAQDDPSHKLTFTVTFDPTGRLIDASVTGLPDRWPLDMCESAGIRLRENEKAGASGVTKRWAWSSPTDESNAFEAEGFESRWAAAEHAIEHHFGRKDWQEAAYCGDTRLGYEEWVLHQAEQYADEHHERQAAAPATPDSVASTRHRFFGFGEGPLATDLGCGVLIEEATGTALELRARYQDRDVAFVHRGRIFDSEASCWYVLGPTPTT